MDDELGKMTAAYEHGEVMQEQYEAYIRESYGRLFRRFVLDRNVDMTGVSGTGIVAEGIEFSDGVIALRWLGGFPTSVVFHDRGLESVLAVHGHDGHTVMRFLDGPSAGVPRPHEHQGDEMEAELQHEHEHEHVGGWKHTHDHAHRDGRHAHEHGESEHGH